MVKRLRVVKANSWDELPEVLEPGVYYVNGERHTIRARVSRDALVKTIERANKEKERL